MCFLSRMTTSKTGTRTQRLMKVSQRKADLIFCERTATTLTVHFAAILQRLRLLRSSDFASKRPLQNRGVVLIAAARRGLPAGAEC